MEKLQFLVLITNDCQSEFDQFYATTLGLLNKYYPKCTITITSRDPEYITPDIKAKLRRKNKLMRAGRIEEADALAERIGTDITNKIAQDLDISIQEPVPETCGRQLGRSRGKVTTIMLRLMESLPPL